MRPRLKARLHARGGGGEYAKSKHYLESWRLSFPSFSDACHVEPTFLALTIKTISCLRQHNSMQGSPLSAASRREAGALRFSPLVGWRREGEPVCVAEMAPEKGESKKNVLDGRRSHLSSSHPSHPSDSRASPAPSPSQTPKPPHRQQEDERRPSGPPPKPQLPRAPPPRRAAASPSARRCCRASRTAPPSRRSGPALTASCCTTTTPTGANTWCRCC